MFGIIFQDFGKYAFTVTDNIAFGDIDRPLDMDEVRDAAVSADADTYISALPDGYATPLQRVFSEEGKELSIGQWQKLSIARAFYSDSDFLILDEPTASLDAIAEQEVFRQFDNLRKDKTTLFVSHRLSSATVANKIIVLDGGTVAEMGDHATLMRARGKYYELFSAQAKRYISTAEEGLIAEEDMEEVHPPHRSLRNQ
jgi:ABC-type multidrug transport system fused ATPase/permease subunit